MIELTQIEIVLMFVLFGGALWYTWRKAEMYGYDAGYHDACADVAMGNITVKLVNPEE